MEGQRHVCELPLYPKIFLGQVYPRSPIWSEIARSASVSPSGLCASGVLSLRHSTASSVAHALGKGRSEEQS